MKKYKFLRISKYKKLRYIANNYKKNLYVVFLPGFASDIDGDKPKKFLKFAIQNKLGFLALEYFGHGRSSGEFTRGNITKWSNDARITISKIVKKNDFILIGSSMGGSMFKTQIENTVTNFIQLTNTQFGSLAYQDSSNITISGGNISVPHVELQQISSTSSNIVMYLKDQSSNFQIKSNDIEYGTNQTVFQVDGEGTASCFQFFTMSDRSLKTNIQPIENAVDLVHKLQGKTFEWSFRYIGDWLCILRGC